MSFINYLPSPLPDKYCVTLSLKIVDEKTKQAAVVDPVEPDTVLQAVKEEGVNLTKVLTTHHHWYVYGIIDLRWILIAVLILEGITRAETKASLRNRRTHCKCMEATLASPF